MLVDCARAGGRTSSITAWTAAPPGLSATASRNEQPGKSQKDSAPFQSSGRPQNRNPRDGRAVLQMNHQRGGGVSEVSTFLQ
jgi:hypothetical protein